MKYRDYEITRIFYQGQEVKAAYGCGGVKVFGGDSGDTPSGDDFLAYYESPSRNVTIPCSDTEAIENGDVPEDATAVVLGNCCKEVGRAAFINNPTSPYTHNRYSELRSITFSTVLIHILSEAFRGSRISTVDLSNSPNFTFISYHAFAESSVSYVSFNESLENIGVSAFEGCIGLEELTLPSTIAQISSNAFKDCEFLSKIEIRAETPPIFDDSAFANTGNCPIYVPSQSVEAYKSAYGWATYASRIQPIP